MICTLDEIRRIIVPIAQKYNLSAVYLFGSYARGTAREGQRPGSAGGYHWSPDSRFF